MWRKLWHERVNNDLFLGRIRLHNSFFFLNFDDIRIDGCNVFYEYVYEENWKFCTCNKYWGNIVFVVRELFRDSGAVLRCAAAGRGREPDKLRL